MPGATVSWSVLSWLGLRVGARLGLFTAADVQFAEERDRFYNDHLLQISRFGCDAHHRMALAELLRISRLSQRTGRPTLLVHFHVCFILSPSF